MKRMTAAFLAALLMLGAAALSACTERMTAEPAVAQTDAAPVTETSEPKPAPVREELKDVTPGAKDGSFECTYAGEKHKFTLCLPEETGENMPLIIMLHGFGNTPDGFRSQCRMDVDACARGYAVAYAGSATAEWNSGIGSMERDDVGYISALAKYLQREYGCSADMTFAAGFSNGGFMTQRLAADAQDVFRAVGCVAGMMPKAIWDERAETADIGVLEVYGTKDDVVPMNLTGTAAASVNPAIEDVMDYWAQANGLDKSETVTLSGKAVLTKRTGEGKDNAVWTVVIDEGRHSWPDEKIAGFNVNQLLLDFFDGCAQ